MPNLDLTDEEHAALVRLVKHALDTDSDRYPESPRLYPLRAILADDVLITARNRPQT